MCVTDADNVPREMEIRAGTGSTNFPLIVKKQWEKEALEIREE